MDDQLRSENESFFERLRDKRLKKGAPTTYAAYFDGTLDPVTAQLLAELGFEEGDSEQFYCEEPAWKVQLVGNVPLGDIPSMAGEKEADGIISGGHIDITRQMVGINDPTRNDNVRDKLETDGFPVDAILRAKRLKALVE